MILCAAPGRGRRVATAGIILVLHLIVGTALVRRGVVAATPRPVAAITVIAVPAPPSPPVTPIPEAPLDAGLVPPAVEMAAQATRAAPACTVIDTLGAALQSDPATVAALTPTALAAAAIEPSRAIMVWNGTWTDAPAVRSIHAVVMRVLHDARDACLDEAITGPRLIFVAAADGTAVSVAFGSSVWKWRSLLSSDQEQTRKTRVEK